MGINRLKIPINGPKIGINGLKIPINEPKLGINRLKNTYKWIKVRYFLPENRYLFGSNPYEIRAYCG
jgi:hypothetical protein